MGQKKPKGKSKKSLKSKVIGGAKKALGMKDKKGRRKETVIGLQNKILKLKLKKKLMKLRYGGRF